MVGTTLAEIRQHIEGLASDDGDYYLVCARTGDHPVPADGLRFASRATARAAASATDRYRATFRRYDPRLPRYDLIVCEDAGPPADPAAPSVDATPTGRCASPEWSLTDPVLDGAASGRERRGLVEFCHRVAAAVFEALSDGARDGVEDAIMDTYFGLADALSDPDELCLCLLESAATELAARLSPAEQAAVLSAAASRLRADPGPADEADVDATFARLRELGVLGSYARSPWSVDLDGGTRSVVVRVSEYALSPRDGRLPTLPVAVELLRRNPARSPAAIRAGAVDDGWRLQLVLARDADPSGLASARIASEV